MVEDMGEDTGSHDAITSQCSRVVRLRSGAFRDLENTHTNYKSKIK